MQPKIDMLALDESLKELAEFDSRKGREMFRAVMVADFSDTNSSRVTGFMDLEVGRVSVKKKEESAGFRIQEDALRIFQDLEKKAPDYSYLADNFGNVLSELGIAHAAPGNNSRLPLESRRDHGPRGVSRLSFSDLS